MADSVVNQHDDSKESTGDKRLWLTEKLTSMMIVRRALEIIGYG